MAIPSTDEVVANAKAMLKQTQAEGSVPFAGSAFDEGIKSQDMTPTPSFDVASPKPATETAGLAGALSGAVQDDQLSQKQAQDVQKYGQAEASSFSDYLNSKLGTQGEVALTAQQYAKKEGVDAIDRERNQINQQISVEQRALTNKLRALEKNPGGLFGTALQDEMGRVERESLAKQADLYIIQQGIQGRYDSAKAIADRAVAVKLEGDRIRNEALKENYERNKELFTKAEQRQFELAYGDRERALNRKEAEIQQISDLSIDALQNGAPSGVVAQMRQAKTLSEAISMGGNYVGLLDRMIKQSQLARMQREIDLLGQPSEAEIKEMQDAKNNAEAAAKVAMDKVETINYLYKENPDGTTYKHPGMAGSVGEYSVSRWTPFDVDKSARQTFIGTVESLKSQEFIDAILSMKKAGGTLGALNEKEGEEMKNAATRIQQWTLKDENGKVYGYEVSEKDFAEELKRLQTLAKRALVESGSEIISEEEDQELDAFIAPYTQSTQPIGGINYY